LVLLGIQFQIEEALHVASGTTATATTSASPLTKSHLDVAECSLGPEQILQRLLFRGQGVLPLRAFQLFGCRAHGLDRLVHIGDEALEGVSRALELASLHAVRKRLRLITEFRLHLGKERGVLGVGAAGALSLGLIPGSGDDLFLTLRNLVLLLALV